MYECGYCEYISNKKSNYKKHLTTKKHLMKKQNLININVCDYCQASFSNVSNLNRHQNVCKNTFNAPKKIVNNIPNTDIIVNLIQENHEIKLLLAEQTNAIVSLVKQNETNLQSFSSSSNNHTHITNNITNNNFNLNVFLNEKCKDAMNIMDFIQSIEVQIEDLIKLGKVGYVKGVTDLIMTNLKKLDIYKRPLHCSDAKRETMYIKNKDTWEKDNIQKERFRKVIKEISMINSRSLHLYKEKYPDCLEYHSKKGNEYDSIMIESLGGINKNVEPSQDKIMRNISRMVLIPKDEDSL